MENESQLPYSPEKEGQDTQLVHLADAHSPEAVMRYKLALDREAIPYFTRNEGLQHLFGLGVVGGYNQVVGPVQFWVLLQSVQPALAAIGLAPAAEGRPMPFECPACGGLNPLFAPECPVCGLAFR